MNRPASSPRQLLAVALMTVREASRRRIFYILILFTLILLSSAFFFPSIDALARVRLIQLWSMRSMLLFSAILAIFVAGFSIPSDLEERRVYILLTKPMSKVVYFLGRLAGFALILGAFMLIMTAVADLYLRVTTWISPPENFVLEAVPRHAAPQRGSENMTENQVLPNGHIVLVGQPEQERIVYRFPDMQGDFPETAKGVVTIKVQGRQGSRFAGRIRLEFGSKEKGWDAVDLECNSASPTPFKFHPRRISSDGTIDFRIRNIDPYAFIIGMPESIQVYTRPEIYEGNMLRGMILYYLYGLVILSVTVMASTFMSAPISILLGLFVLLIGMGYGFIEDGVREVDHFFQAQQQAAAEGREISPPEDIPVWALKSSSVVSSVALSLIGDQRTYDFSPHLLEDRAIPAGKIVEAAKDALLRVLILVLVGILVMFFKEIE